MCSSVITILTLLCHNNNSTCSIFFLWGGGGAILQLMQNIPYICTFVTYCAH